MDQTFWPSHWPESSQAPDPGATQRSDAAKLCRAVAERLDIICEAAESNDPRLRAGASNSVMTAVRQVGDLFFGLLYGRGTVARGSSYSQAVGQEFVAAVGSTEVAALEKVITGFTLDRGAKINPADVVPVLTDGLDHLIDATWSLEHEPASN